MPPPCSPNSPWFSFKMEPNELAAIGAQFLIAALALESAAIVSERPGSFASDATGRVHFETTRICCKRTRARVTIRCLVRPRNAVARSHGWRRGESMMAKYTLRGIDSKFTFE